MLREVLNLDGYALLEEGRMMRHCADICADRCERRRYVMLSVRRVETNARVATVGMIWERGTATGPSHGVRRFECLASGASDCPRSNVAYAAEGAPHGALGC